MKTVDKALRRMGELSMLALDQSKSSADRALYDKEFQELKSYIIATKSQAYNGVPLFGSSSNFAVTIDAEGSTFSVSAIDLDSTSYANAYASTIALGSTTFATDALARVKDAISKIAIDRAQLGAVQARLNFTSEQLVVTRENLSSAISRIADCDVAEEATQYARYQILVQSGTQMLTQANQLPQSALTLLRQ